MADPFIEKPFDVVQIVRLTPAIVELWLRPLADRLQFVPGQYLLLEDRHQRLGPRSYSIANAPRHDGLLSLLVTRVAGGSTSTWIHDCVAVGTVAFVCGPFGTFVDDPDSSSDALFLAAGSGLAPVRSLLEAAIATGNRRSMTLVVSARAEADVIDRGRFEAWERKYSRFRFIRTLTGERGLPPLGRIPALLPNLDLQLSGCDIFVAGAPGFVRACASVAEALNVERSRVHTEEFFFEPHPWAGAAPEIQQKG